MDRQRVRNAILLYFILSTAGCCSAPSKETMEQNKATIEWLNNEAWTPNCINEPWPQCMRKPTP